ncbi:thioester domain-containing protein [uncultured Chitinophaga sp.]|uniref:thioester domain-containing protein n=1 Tax=uncultured Chitinophaga sp. TaxID=339340 RepID=UPI0025F1F5F4|nr:thioester domain-containing protein [uncultured Chitinophaga sp.]
MKKILFVLLLASLSLAACSKDAEKASADTASIITAWHSEPGFGPSGKPFRSAAWQLPAGVELTSGGIHEYSFCTGNSKGNFDYATVKGVPGGVFNVCFELRNSTSQPVTINFPDDLLIQSTNTNYQNGLLMGIGSVTLAAGEAQKVYANAFCINEKRAVPGAYDYEGNLLSFRFGPGEVPAALKTVTDIARSKGLTSSHITDGSGKKLDYKKMENIGQIQLAVWEVTSGKGLSPATLALLNSIAVR